MLWCEPVGIMMAQRHTFTGGAMLIELTRHDPSSIIDSCCKSTRMHFIVFSISLSSSPFWSQAVIDSWPIGLKQRPKQSETIESLTCVTVHYIFESTSIIAYTIITFWEFLAVLIRIYAILVSCVSFKKKYTLITV